MKQSGEKVSCFNAKVLSSISFYCAKEFRYSEILLKARSAGLETISLICSHRTVSYTNGLRYPSTTPPMLSL